MFVVAVSTLYWNLLISIKFKNLYEVCQLRFSVLALKTSNQCKNLQKLYKSQIEHVGNMESQL